MKRSPHGYAAMLAVLLVSTVVGRSDAQDLRITNARVVDVVAGSIGEATDVAVHEGRIAEIGPGAGGDGAGQSIDAQGSFLLPGLWDAHVHLANRPDPPLAPERQLEIYLSYGVTSVRDMGGDAAVLVALRQQAASGEIDSAHLDGWSLPGRRRGASRVPGDHDFFGRATGDRRTARTPRRLREGPGETGRRRVPGRRQGGAGRRSHGRRSRPRRRVGPRGRCGRSADDRTRFSRAAQRRGPAVRVQSARGRVARGAGVYRALLRRVPVPTAPFFLVASPICEWPC